MFNFAEPVTSQDISITIVSVLIITAVGILLVKLGKKKL
jgi:hypothetical protein